MNETYVIIFSVIVILSNFIIADFLLRRCKNNFIIFALSLPPISIIIGLYLTLKDFFKILKNRKDS